MSKESNIIKKIVLNIEGKEISLTPEQAQKLLVALTDLLGVKKEVIKEKEYVPYPVYPSYPYRPYWHWDTYTTTWGDYRTKNAEYCSASFDSGTARVIL